MWCAPSCEYQMNEKWEHDPTKQIHVFQPVLGVTSSNLCAESCSLGALPHGKPNCANLAAQGNKLKYPLAKLVAIVG